MGSYTATIFQGSWDSLGLGLVIAVAIGYLYIRLWKGRKSCHACPSNGAGCSSCHVLGGGDDGSTNKTSPDKHA
nr:hypothetical protein [uncultured Cohaesibacter sp.]